MEQRAVARPVLVPARLLVALHVFALHAAPRGHGASRRPRVPAVPRRAVAYGTRDTTQRRAPPLHSPDPPRRLNPEPRPHGAGRGAGSAGEGGAWGRARRGRDGRWAGRGAEGARGLSGEGEGGAGTWARGPGGGGGRGAAAAGRGGVGGSAGRAAPELRSQKPREPADGRWRREAKEAWARGAGRPRSPRRALRARRAGGRVGPAYLLRAPSAPRRRPVLCACGAAARSRPLSPRFPAEQDVAAGAAARAPAAAGRAERRLSPRSRCLPRAFPGPGPRPPPRSVWAAASALRAGTRATRLARSLAAAGRIRERGRPRQPATFCVLFPTPAPVALPRNNPKSARWLLLPYLCSQHLLLWL